MASFARRAGFELMKLLKSAADPAAELDRALIYTKIVGTVAQLFVRPSNGVVYQLTPFGGGAGSAMFYGDGSDGNVTIAAGTTTLTKDTFYDTLTIQTGGILKPDGFRIFAKTAIVMQGTGKITVTGNPGGDGNGGAGGIGGTTIGVPLGNIAGKNGGTGGLGAGTAGTNSTPGAPGHTMAGGAGGAGTNAGAAGGTFTGNTVAGDGGLALAIWCVMGRVGGVVAFSGSPGGGGGGGTFAASGAGGGGAGGNYAVVCAPKISGDIEARGGNGGNGAGAVSPSGGGGGGAGGVIVCVCGDGNFPTLNVTGGTGGNAANGGVAGSNGQTGKLYQFSGI